MGITKGPLSLTNSGNLLTNAQVKPPAEGLTAFHIGFYMLPSSSWRCRSCQVAVWAQQVLTLGSCRLHAAFGFWFQELPGPHEGLQSAGACRRELFGCSACAFMGISKPYEEVKA